ncbi:MAG: iron transporter [Candidatus Omnitrophica bacterium CG1_02_46_14]|nr:MAG: iron transporter [Candidatus Omnitrophica bacterium CG1_02_46_14]
MALRKIAILGSPNVGKSVLFHRLTGRYVTVSNYPGTTVEVSRGVAELGSESYEVIDTPGMYTFLPLQEEERVARQILLTEDLFLVVHVIEAISLSRMLPLTLQLIEAELPTILVLNMMDEAHRRGITIDLIFLQEELGIPVVGAVATNGKGIEDLKQKIVKYVR